MRLSMNSKKKGSRTAAVFLAVLPLLLFFPAALPARGEESSAFTQTQNTAAFKKINSSYGILVNADTGEILAQQDATARMYPASMTKVMTVLVAAEKVSNLSDTVEITQDILLISIFGGILNGVAISMCLSVDATSGGTDFISIFLSQKRGMDCFHIILGFNVVILLIAGWLFGWDKALYSIIFQYVSTQTIHLLYRNYQQVTLLINTEYPEAVCEAIYDTSRHGATYLDAMGSHDHRNMPIVYSVISASDTKKVIKAIRDIDPKAFINCLTTKGLRGNFYYSPKD